VDIESLVGLFFIRIGVAVNTAVRAGVISSNVCAFRAAAFISRGFFFVLEAIRKEQALNDTAIDTMGFPDSVIY